MYRILHHARARQVWPHKWKHRSHCLQLYLTVDERLHIFFSCVYDYPLFFYTFSALVVVSSQRLHPRYHCDRGRRLFTLFFRFHFGIYLRRLIAVLAFTQDNHLPSRQNIAHCPEKYLILRKVSLSLIPIQLFAIHINYQRRYGPGYQSTHRERRNQHGYWYH